MANNLNDVQTKILFDAYVTFCYKKLYPNYGWFYSSGNYPTASKKALQTKGYIDYMGNLVEPKGLEMAEELFDLDDVADILTPKIEEQVFSADLSYVVTSVARKYIENEMSDFVYPSTSFIDRGVIVVHFDVFVEGASGKAVYKYNIISKSSDCRIYSVYADDDDTEAAEITLAPLAEKAAKELDLFFAEEIKDLQERSERSAKDKIAQL